MSQQVECFDAIVIGSGFGGSVATYRLARANKQVCLLERGKAFPPNSFPRSPHRMRENFWDPSEGLMGLFDIWSFDHLSTVISSGLGGGSLIYSNVLLRKDERWFVDDLAQGGYETWPITRAELDRHYGDVERMMAATPYPFGHDPFDKTGKTIALRDSADTLKKRGLPIAWSLPPLGVAFGSPGRAPGLGEPISEEHPNYHDKPRHTCRLCGECNIGCNYGSKSSLDYTYLSAAKRLGADIRPRHEVKRIAATDSGFEVYYVIRSPEQEGKIRDRSKPRELRRMACKQLFLAAGTLGTTFLMLKNRAFLSRAINWDAVGTRVSGNGDLLSFALNAKDPADQSRARELDPSFGPVITSAIRMGDTLDDPAIVGRGFYIEDAGYPNFINWMVQAFDVRGLVKRAATFAAAWLKLRVGITNDADLSREISDILGDSSFTKSSLPLLGMGRDIPDGRMSLNIDGRLSLAWTLQKQGPYFDRMRRTMRELTEAMGAEYRDTLGVLASSVITVHPLGGCPMSVRPNDGVVDHACQVNGQPGLFIVDGSVMPGPVGPNPALTIAAIADRAAELALEKRNAV